MLYIVVRCAILQLYVGEFSMVANTIVLTTCFVNTMFFVLYYLLLSVDVVLRVYLELFSLGIALQHCSSTTPGRMQVGYGPWIRWLVSRIRSCADKLGGGWERDKAERTAKLYDDDGHGIDVGLRLLPLAAVIMAARVLPPQTNRRRMTKKRGTRGENTHSQLCVVKRYGAPLCAFNLLRISTQSSV